MQIPEDILLLIEKYQAGTATAEEKHRLDQWYHSFDDSYAELQGSSGIGRKMLHRLQKKLFEPGAKPQETKRSYRKWRLPAVAACLLIILLPALFYFLQRNTKGAPEKSIVINGSPKVEIRPGGNKALLTLADGSTVVLDSASNGIISRQGNIRIQKLENGLLAYTNSHGQAITEKDEAFYNTITTPRGGKYQVTLSDGTKVWLNAASSIRFPVAFAGNERSVEMSGEAYFEVAKDKTKPFKVKASISEIEVLGTHFNINAYADEPSIKTTLLEGEVKVSVSGSTAKPAFMKPGQQTGIGKDGKIDLLNNADLEEAVAWKNGRFQFKSADLPAVLRQLSRWYDIDIEDKSNTRVHFTGQLSRDENVSKVFNQLELTGEVRIRSEGRKITVLP